MRSYAITPALIVALASAAGTSVAAPPEPDCTLEFTSTQWSAIYESLEGEGTVSCDDGTSMPVDIRAIGVGITAGQWKITEGTGRFTHVTGIDDVLGRYIGISADLGAGLAHSTKRLQKGRASLTLAGKGEGFDIGLAVTQFHISRAATAPAPPAAP